LAEPEIALAGEQAVAEDGAHVAEEEGVLGVVAAAGDQHLLHHVGMGQEQGGVARQAEGGHVAIARGRGEEGQQVAAEIGEAA
jgi:hypothetical protein